MSRESTAAVHIFDEFDSTTVKAKIPWPTMEREAYHGLPGEIADALAPETEADPNAMLIQTVVVAGNVMGRSPHFMVGGARHGMNEYVCLVGETSQGRKGQSLAELKPLYAEAELYWAKKCQGNGLSSGEGLVYAIRDAREEDKPIREKGKVTGYERVQVDGGVEDKRLLVTESEMGRVLSVMTRDGNTLSAILRQAWDGGELRGMVRNNPDRCQEPHVSVIGHITKPELLKLLSQNDSSNGFANRFLWVCARRAQYLPDGGNLPDSVRHGLVAKLQLVIEKAKHQGCINRDPEARDLWHSIYRRLSDGQPGLLGFVTSRGEAHVARIAAIYALLDGDDHVRVHHLEASLAVWGYCENSARWVFGAGTGDPLADRILGMLRDMTSGMTRTEVYRALGCNIKSEDIQVSLDLLQEKELARKEQKIVEGGKRNSEVWFSVSGTERTTY